MHICTYFLRKAIDLGIASYGNFLPFKQKEECSVIFLLMMLCQDAGMFRSTNGTNFIHI